jgi:hypothetical protein
LKGHGYNNDFIPHTRFIHKTPSKAELPTNHTPLSPVAENPVQNANNPSGGSSGGIGGGRKSLDEVIGALH